jgi:DNA polymerase alpha subunit A
MLTCSQPARTAEDEAFMADLLGEVDVNITSRRPAPRTKSVKDDSRRKVRILSPPLKHARQSSRGGSSQLAGMGATPPAELNFNDDEGLLPHADDDVLMSDPLPSSPITNAVERRSHPTVKVEEEDDDDDLMHVAQPIGRSTSTGATVNMSGSRPAPKIKKSQYPTPGSSSPAGPPSRNEIDASAWTKVTDQLNILSTPATPSTSAIGKLQAQHAVEDDGSLRMFWLDYTEIKGSLCLIGKVKDKSTGNFVSCFVKVDNILRKLFFLPREYRQKNGRDTDEEIGMGDVYEEVSGIMSKLRVGSHKIKPCSRKYAFELPDIPKEADYLKLLYPYDNQALSMDLKGETFAHVFGANTSLFEQFVLWKNVMGPCWLNIQNANFGALNNASWCKLEIQVDNPQFISILGESDNLEAPPLTLMSISLRTTYNAKDNKQEILIASARVYENVSLSDTKTPTRELPQRTFTVMRPVVEVYPPGFQKELEKHNGSVELEKNEGGLLSKFMARFGMCDPDVILGHKLDDVDYGILLSRMRERKTPGWHRIGRLRRSEWPKNMGKGGGSFYAERALVSGRLICDLANDMGKSLMTKCQSWSLNEMCDLVLGESRQELDNEVALKTWATTREGLLNYVKHCETDTHFIASIALKVQMLPLTKVLTNLAGNSWARTLSGTRAERNEYILLHEFHRNKYICPDKIWGKGRQEIKDEAAEGEEGVDAKKKDKFKGGLVFEPEKGLYDKCILVMDFNSLYPSIIQEFNICFTTVERSDIVSVPFPPSMTNRLIHDAQNENEERVPEVPHEQALGILPKLIATLVSRRREVKKLMKDKHATADQLTSWDIKQLALKLTANSMYGCLGYTKSRFYARPLAMLTTYKGREILRSTKELAETNSLRVIYGDTDSVMINTNMDNIQDALKVGNDFKRAVNERYKLLEIDIDNVFRRLLLHAKKKYAAINMIQVDDNFVEKLEVKGLDMRRREYCQLSKDTST